MIWIRIITPACHRLMWIRHVVTLVIIQVILNLFVFAVLWISSLWLRCTFSSRSFKSRPFKSRLDVVAWFLPNLIFLLSFTQIILIYGFKSTRGWLLVVTIPLPEISLLRLLQISKITKSRIRKESRNVISVWIFFVLNLTWSFIASWKIRRQSDFTFLFFVILVNSSDNTFCA